MANELAVIQPTNLAEAKDLAGVLSKSSLLADAFRGKESDVLMVVMAGSELGMRPMQALQSFDVIKGKLGMKPIAMLALVRGHSSIEYIDCETSPTACTVESKRKSSPKVLKTTFTIQNAQTAGLTASEMYRKWPEQMVMWRAVAIHCKKHHSDITMGHNTTDEVADELPTAPIPVLSSQPSRAEDVLRSKMQPVTSAPVVDVVATPASPPRARIVDETGADVRPPPKTPPPAPVETPWSQVLAICRANLIDWRTAAAWLKEHRGIKSGKECSAADAEAYKAHVELAKVIPLEQEQTPF